jgi:hypothetical protein
VECAFNLIFGTGDQQTELTAEDALLCLNLYLPQTTLGLLIKSGPLSAETLMPCPSSSLNDDDDDADMVDRAENEKVLLY